ncbi:HMG (high mobility group) box domain containing protein [Acanthamoeba castellanii str. Neff]|uniref:HMG (High mobility group) box domain containing protein n=1 Tax=Acanthamoeba castellanii (strain ATCC 30010 / Neff) TaxID=1257118 RepID=L8H892_ACACF|nr:HMG (high mobility group) box domain containing protein [Acanthamoeba castellanii str. Neff]ELR21457.1 HMG (high mobility group) box domain containing protein [Acanthamoeba castellanii str. Neff]
MSDRPKRSTKQPSRFGEDEKKKAAAEAKKVGVQKKKAISKKKRIPPGVKRPKTAYIIYAQSARAKVKEENPSAGFGELTKLVSAQWNAMSEEEKAPFAEEAAKDKKRYEREVKAADPGSDEGEAAKEDDEDEGSE